MRHGATPDTPIPDDLQAYHAMMRVAASGGPEGARAAAQVRQLRRELDNLRAQMRKHDERHHELETLVRALIAAGSPEEPAQGELSPEQRAELDRIKDWPFLDEYPPVGTDE